MERLTEEQQKGISAVRQDLVDVRAKLERLHLPTAMMSNSWARISNAHAELGRVLECERMRDKAFRRAAAG